jgi:hypothetical protein
MGITGSVDVIAKRKISVLDENQTFVHPIERHFID